MRSVTIRAGPVLTGVVTFDNIGGVATKGENLQTVRGSGNVFRDLGHKNADAEQFKAILAAEIVKALDREGLAAPASRRPTSRASAMRISGVSPPTGSCRLSTGWDRASR
jgi:hypothetical protein